MLILAIETSGRGGSVALLQDERVAGRLAIEEGQAAQRLAPAVAQLCEDLGIAAQQLNLIAVGTGPGSFTGLRIGITTAKTLAYALGCDVIGIDTLDAIAAQVPAKIPLPLGEGGRRPGEGVHPSEQPPVIGPPQGRAELHVVMDAQRRELFLARYGPAEEETAAASPWLRRGQTQLVAAEAWLSQLQPPTIVSGPGLKRLVDQVPAGVDVVAADLWQPDAETVGRLAFAAWQAGRRDDLFKLAPTYLRPSYAEDKAK